MDIRVSINGVDVVVTVRDVAEATSFLSSLASLKTSSLAASASHLPADSSEHRIGALLRTPSHIPASMYDDAIIRKVLLRLRGNPSSRLLQKLSESPNGSCTDNQLKDALSIDGDEHLGPTISNISKQCKKLNLPLESIVTKVIKRGAEGKMRYKYRITDQASRLVREIDKFTDPVEFPEFEDDEDTE